MIYIYTKEMCSACEQLKLHYKANSTEYVERDGARLSNDSRIFDDIDREAFIQLQQQNLTFPVKVDY